MLLMNNPTWQGYSNPWQGQGDVIETGGGYSTPDEAPGRFWDWWGRNGEEATDFLNSVICAIKPEHCRTPGPYPYPVQTRQDNTVLYILLGIIVVLLVVFMFKMQKG